ncbi:MAG: helix-hairpin-helix domain-containing protein [Alistipes sp.]|nr:helix-hairpin-helix domain-containing protein [Alistipes sp.]
MAFATCRVVISIFVVMSLYSESQRRGLLVMVVLLFILLAIYLLAERMQPVELLQEQTEAVALQNFDPNVDSYETLRAKGVPTEVAVGMVRWRSYGKVYRIREDLALVSGMTDSLYGVLAPYISIADSVAPRADRVVSRRDSKPRREEPREKVFPKEKFLIDTASAQYLTRWGLSPRQAEVVVRYRDAGRGIHSEEQLRACYVISDEVAERMLPYVIFTPERETVWAVEKPTTECELPAEQSVEINTADSATLVAIDGIGARSASEIIKYRTLLGGYYSVEQIRELKVITESNFEKILPKIWCDSFVISKIDINFARSLELERHPYISARALRRIVKQRQLKGGWTRIEEMIDDDILSEEEAERLAPYLRFRPSATE